jgi:hypothetical protein
MGVRRLRLSGIETDILKMIANGFRFSNPDLKDYALVLDRNLFANDMPDAADIAITASDADNGLAFDAKKEPAIVLYRQPGSGIDPTMSSGSRLAFNFLIVLRVPKTLQDAADMLGELVVWLEMNAAGQTTEHFEIRSFKTLGLPIPYQRLSDDKSAASATVRFLAVARL